MSDCRSGIRFKVGVILPAVLAAVWFCAMPVRAEESPEQFVKGTSINTVSVGGLTVEEAKAKIQKNYTDTYQLEITGKNGKKEVISGEEIGYSASDFAGLQEILDGQNAGGRRWGPSVDHSYTLDIPAVYNTAALEARIMNLSFLNAEDIVVTSDAHVSSYQEGQPFTIIPEVDGNNVDAAKAEAVIKAAVSSGKKQVNIEQEGCYYVPGVRAGDEGLKELCRIMNACMDMTVTYTFGEAPVLTADEGAGQTAENGEDAVQLEEESREGTVQPVTERLTGDVIASWLTGTENGEINVNRDAAAAYIKTLADRYNTAGTARIFRTYSGRDVELSGPFGWKIDQAGETEALIGIIRTGQSQSREPLYVGKKGPRSAADWGTTYVEIDLTGQHVYMFQDGNLVWDSDCVTGNVSKKYTTPAGIYSLAYTETDRIRRGEKKADGTYE